MCSVWARPLQKHTAGKLFALNSNLPPIYLYMLTPQPDLSDLPGGHCVTKWGPGRAVRDEHWKHRYQNIIYKSHNRVHREIHTHTCARKRVSGPRKVAGFARGWDFSWWRLECGAAHCVLLSSSLAHFWFVVQQLLADQIKNDGTPEKCSNLFSLSASFASLAFPSLQIATLSVELGLWAPAVTCMKMWRGKRNRV